MFQGYACELLNLVHDEDWVSSPGYKIRKTNLCSHVMVETRLKRLEGDGHYIEAGA
jgi:hypothetical protein